MSEQNIVIYHGNCPDGFGAALACWTCFGAAAEYIPAAYGDNPPDVKGRHVHIVDFSFPRETLERMHAEAASLRVIDHHKTAKEDLSDLDYATFDMGHSGAVLTWQELYPHEDVPILLLYIEDRDLWLWKLNNSHAVSLALWALPRDFESWSIHLHDISQLEMSGSWMVEYQRCLVSQMADNARFGRLGGYLVPIVNATACFSEVGDELCRRYPERPFAAYYFDRADGKRQWGLRSRRGFDVSVVAKSYGGGGHPAAAGFTEDLEQEEAGDE